ncbi:hypothetical protein C9374_007874 [Naegleria lovaniensis]|uniref:Guanylate cyclase n=1 Tax=Naegleria lovaniensis TaxID=51637 RepID=A0AA88GLL7_NAELO|nr:uncharacterized protein C9374_007874 [Naegleria lovaniensis]KAG2378726.1 hypothetical protein C9374_007874 [Naegleria lovaniensis]
MLENTATDTVDQQQHPKKASPPSETTSNVKSLNLSSSLNINTTSTTHTNDENLYSSSSSLSEPKKCTIKTQTHSSSPRKHTVSPKSPIRDHAVSTPYQNTSNNHQTHDLLSHEKVIQTALPPFFTPHRVNHYTSPVIHYDRNSSIILTCKYTPQNYKGHVILPLDTETVYCVKVSLNVGSIAQLENDAEISKYLHKESSKDGLSAAPKVLAYLSDYFILVREFIHGETFRSYIDKSSLLTNINTDTVAPEIDELAKLLRMAIEACDVLEQLHSLRICHCDVRPENFMYDTQLSCVRLIDFGLSNFLPLDNPFIYTNRPKGCFKYMAPESTGKIPKPIGFHSDIYSFGFVLFEMISKEHPFGNKLKNTDYMYCHIAQVPELLITNLSKRGMLNAQHNSSILNNTISALSLVISKMVQKSIEKRYLSISGVNQDLSFILSCLTSNDTVSLNNFTPGQFDVQTCMKIPYVVYGREDVIINISLALNEMMDSQSPKAVLISGYSGIGKSCVVREFRNKAREDVLYFEAKYDQNHNIPFFAINTVVSEITEASLGESEQFIQEFREQLVSHLNTSQMDMLCDAIPNLSILFFSFQKRPNALVFKDEHNENMKVFSQSIIHLLRVYAQMKRKNLCIFLDDLQWADYESLTLLKEVLGLGQSEAFPFLLIGAFRNNELRANNLHPLNMFIQSIKMKNVITEIELSELTEEQCNLLVAESVHRSLSDTAKLTSILYSKTQGNPFFLKQLLVSLFREGKIFFNKSLRQLSWNLEEIEKAQYTQNVVEFLLLKFGNMEPATKKAISYASCIGNKFLFHELRELMNIDTQEYSTLELKEVISQAIKEGWISYLDCKTLRFNHDRLQQAANESISEQTKAFIHYKFGKFKLKQVEAGEIVLDDVIFEIVAHLNYRSKDPKILKSPDKRRYLLTLNKLAAKKAVNTCATEQAQVFVNTAIDFLKMEEQDVWEGSLYNTAFELLMAQGNCEYVTNVDIAIQTFNSAIQKAKTKSHLFEACYHAIMAYLSQSKYEQVYDVLSNHVFTSYEQLNFLHETLDKEYLQLWIDNKISIMKQQLIPKLSKTDIIELPELKDPETVYLVHLIAQSAPAVYHINKPHTKLVLLIMLLMATEIVLTKGLCPLAPLILTQVGGMWCIHDFYPQINVVVEAGVDLARTRFKNLHNLASCLLLKEMSYFIFPNINAQEVWNITEEAFLLSIKSNNKSFGGFAIMWYPFHHFFYTSCDMKTSIELSKKSIQICKNVGNYMLLDASQMILEMKRVLSGESESFDPTYHCENIVQYPFFRQLHFMFKGITCFFQQNYGEAFLCMEKSYEYRQDSVGLCSTWIDIVFQGLVSCAYQRHLISTNNQNPDLIHRCEVLVDYSLKMLEQVSQANPLVFLCSLELVKAEDLYCRYLKYGEENSRSIISCLNKSLKLAIRDRNHFIAKIANWKMGELYKSLEMDDYVSGSYFSRAYDQFLEMGLSIVVDHIWDNYRYQIEEYNRETLSQKNSTASYTSSSVSSSDKSSSQSQELTLSAVTKSRIAEQSELDFKEIFISILPLLSEHTDASRCCLLLKRDSKINLDAEFNADIYASENTPLPTVNHENISIDKFADTLPLKLIYRTLRTRVEQKNLQEGDVESYFSKNRVASALCIPIIRDKSVLGCVYLENRETEDVFTVEKISIAKLIISISIDNATIFNSINKSYARFLPAEFLKLLGKSHVTKIRLGDAISREMTVLFSDIYGFTDLMEKFSAKEGFSFINKLLFQIAPPISRNSGFIDKILGDGIMALFTDPQSAVNAALEMISQLEAFNKENIFNIKLGIGISNGTVSLGTIGYEERLDATVISDTTNVASRCESLSRNFKSRIIVTEGVINAMKLTPESACTAIYLGKFILKGKQVYKDLYDIRGKNWQSGIAVSDFEQSTLTEIVSLFQHKNFNKCSHLAKEMTQQTDHPFVSAMCGLYLQACGIYHRCRLPENWAGEIRLSKDGEPKPYYLDDVIKQ